MKRKRYRKTATEMLKIYGAGVVLGLVILFAAFQFVEPAPPKSLTIATASSQGAYYGYAQRYKQLFAKEKIELKVLETSGSVENLQLLQEGNADVAFVQGGVGKSDEYPELEGLASLYLEPLIIFVPKGLRVDRMTDLRGKKIAAGTLGSGTRKIVEQLLADNNMIAPSDIEVLPLGGEEGAEALRRGDVDALFLVIRASAPMVAELYHDPSIKLVSLTRAESYTRLHKYLSHVVLLEGVLDMADNLPEQDYHLIAPSATLVAGENMHPAHVDLLMQIITKVHNENSVLKSAKDAPSRDNLDFPLSVEAERFFKHGPPFLQRFLPFWAASLIDRLKFMVLPLIAIIIPLMKVLPPTYRWRIRSRIYRWYDELHALDLELKNNETRENIEEAMRILAEMEQEIREVEVPLSYAEELYHLRLHLDLLRNQCERALKELG